MHMSPSLYRQLPVSLAGSSSASSNSGVLEVTGQACRISPSGASTFPGMFMAQGRLRKCQKSLSHEADHLRSESPGVAAANTISWGLGSFCPVRGPKSGATVSQGRNSPAALQVRGLRASHGSWLHGPRLVIWPPPGSMSSHDPLRRSILDQGPPCPPPHLS